MCEILGRACFVLSGEFKGIAKYSMKTAGATALRILGYFSRSIFFDIIEFAWNIIIEYQKNRELPSH